MNTGCWAVVGVYGTGTEPRLSVLRRRIEECDDHALSEGDVLLLGEDAIHSVENPLRKRTAGLHVYGGDIVLWNAAPGVQTAAKSPSPRMRHRPGRCSKR